MIHRHLLDLTGEFELSFVVRIGHRCSLVDAHIRSIISREDVRLGMLDSAFGRLLAVDVNGAFPSITASAVVGEVKLDEGLAGREGCGPVMVFA